MSALRKAFGHLPLATCHLLIATSLLLIANLFIFTPPTSAAGAWAPLNSNNYQDEIATQRFGRNILVFGHVALLGTNPLNGNTYSEKITYNTKDGQTTISSVPGIGPGELNGGALGMTTKAIAALYNPPTSSVEYLANLGQNIGLAPKPAYAANETPGIGGSGDGVIAPVLKLWQVTRNIAYVGFILVFVAAGVMIMFRQKLNPQTVIGIQQALPGLVIGLILVTFSYFIAALIVDLSFVGTRLVTEIFISTNTPNYYGCSNGDLSIIPGQDCTADKSKVGLNEIYNKSDAFYMFGKVGARLNNITDVFGQVWGTLKSTDSSPSKLDDLINDPLGSVLSRVGGWINDRAQDAAAGVIASLASILVPLILAIALMIQFIKLIIALVMSYLQILIMVIFGPFFIMFSAIPGRGGALGYWLKGLLANALVFPAVFAGFLFAGMLLQWNGVNLNGSNMPLFGGLHPDILKSVLAFGVLLGLPSIPEMVRGAFGVKGPQGFAQAAIGGFMGGVSGVRTGYNQGMEKGGIYDVKAGEQKARQDNLGWAGATRKGLAKWLPKL